MSCEVAVSTAEEQAIEILRIHEVAFKCNQVDTDEGFPADLLAIYEEIVKKHGLKKKFHHSGEQMRGLANQLRTQFLKERGIIIPSGR